MQPTPKQLIILNRVYLVGQNRISERCCCCSKYMGKKLAELGWVERTLTSYLPHVAMLRLTEAGRKLVESL